MVDEIKTNWPNGHFFSPVVDPTASVRTYWEREQKITPDRIAEIPLDLNSMIDMWIRHRDTIAANQFPERPDGTSRFYTANGAYPSGDAACLGMMMRRLRPRRIIEVGSGHSSACMLDWAERLALPGFKLTCIEPFPAALKRVLRPGDDVRIIPSMVQDVDLALFAELDASDILFIDSTHVLKTGSDVHFVLMYILPILKPGVIIHFHDCAYPFEYDEKAIFDLNFSWNEAYALRCFLMYNTVFSVVFWNSMFYRFCSPPMRADFASRWPNPGGGIWIVKNT